MMNSTMTRDRAIEIARQAAAHNRPSYYAEPFEPHPWVVDAILNAAHLAVHERFDATVLSRLIDAWIDTPSDGIVPVGFGDGLQNLLNVLGEFLGRDQLLKNPEVQRRGEIASVKAKLIWWRDQLKSARRYDMHEEEEKALREIAEVEAKARELGIEVES